MRFVSAVGVLISFAFIGCAALMNWQYGMSLGRSDIDQYTFAAVGLAIDAAKIVLPFFLWAALRNRQIMPAAVAFFALMGCVAYSMSGLAGYVDLNAAKSTGTLTAKQETAAGLKAKLDRKHEQLAALGVTRPPTVIESELAGLRQDKRWSSSRECSDATAAASREFCTVYSAKRGEHAKALAAEAFEREVAELRKELNGLAPAAAIDRGDPRAGFVSRLLDTPLLEVQTGLSLIFILTVEIMSTFGVFISLRHGELRSVARVAGSSAPAEAAAATSAAATLAAPAVEIVRPPRKKVEAVIEDKREVGDIRVFVLERMQPKEGETVLVRDLYPIYNSWCQERGFRAVSVESFVDLFGKLCTITGFKVEQDASGTVARNLRLAA